MTGRHGEVARLARTRMGVTGETFEQAVAALEGRPQQQPDQRTTHLTVVLRIPPRAAHAADVLSTAACSPRWQVGRCWLGCGRDDVRVMWIGQATADGTTMPMWACEADTHQLRQLVWLAATAEDRAAAGLPPPGS